MVKLGTYAAASAVGAIAVVFHAFQSRRQFYPAMLYLATSKISLVLLLNMALVLMCAVWQALKVLFLGTLREAEVERLNEQSWRELMEILFAMTIFREEFNVSFVAMVTLLLFIKAFHWLAQKRVEYIETTPSVSRLSHFRIISFMVLLLFLDALFLHNSVSFLLRTKRPSVSLFFAFEYVILATSTVATFLKYTFYICDIFMEGQWENKAVFTFYLELVRDLLHLSLYLFFFLVIFINYGLPLHLVRELYETFRNFKARVADYIRYRKITSNMNHRFPDASQEELGRSDATCIICREEMTAAKKLPCGHLFHVHCLRSWLERQQTCPTCRSPVLVPEGVAAVPGVDGAIPHLQPQQQQQQPVEGQAVLPEAQGVSGQVQGQPSGDTIAGSFYGQNQARMQAAISAASQYGTSFVYPAINAGTANRCPAYVYLVPQPYLVAMLGAGMNVQNSAHAQFGFRNPSSDNASDSNQVSSANALFQGVQPTDIDGQRQFGALGEPLCNVERSFQYAGVYGQSGFPMPFNPGAVLAYLQWQQTHLQHGIESFQQQLGRIVELQNQLISLRTESDQNCSAVEQATASCLGVDFKGKTAVFKDIHGESQTVSKNVPDLTLDD